MPVASVGFHLKPFGFFDGNPMLDLPAATSCHCPPGRCGCAGHGHVDAGTPGSAA